MTDSNVDPKIHDYEEMKNLIQSIASIDDPAVRRDCINVMRAVANGETGFTPNSKVLATRTPDDMDDPEAEAKAQFILDLHRSGRQLLPQHVVATFVTQRKFGDAVLRASQEVAEEIEAHQPAPPTAPPLPHFSPVAPIPPAPVTNPVMPASPPVAPAPAAASTPASNVTPAPVPPAPTTTPKPGTIKRVTEKGVSIIRGT